MKEFETLKTVCGIDTLYYFCESNASYDLFYMDILDDIERIKGNFEKKEIEFVNQDITVIINDIPMYFCNKAEGFYWFMDINEFFKIGFKDTTRNLGLHDIQVQLMGVGIYTLGIKALIAFIDTLLCEISTPLRNITRMDVNCFVQYDFSFVTKSMFVTRKRQYANYGEIGNATDTQTLCIGKKPFYLRLYNKTLEMKKSKKEALMNEYFCNHGFDMKQPIFNVEFEMHRAHLKSFGISTLEDALSHAQLLFKDAMDAIRLIDIHTVSEKSIKNNTKNRAKILPIWEYIQSIYNIDAFLQVTMPLERIKKVVSIFSEEVFDHEFQTLIRKALTKNLLITPQLLIELLDATVASLEIKKATIKKGYVPIEIKNTKGDKEHFRLLKSGQLVKPVNVLSVTKLSDYELLLYLDDITADFQKEDVEFEEVNKRYKVAYNEAVRRKLMPYVPF